MRGVNLVVVYVVPLLAVVTEVEASLCATKFSCWVKHFSRRFEIGGLYQIESFEVIAFCSAHVCGMALKFHFEIPRVEAGKNLVFLGGDLYSSLKFARRNCGELLWSVGSDLVLSFASFRHFFGGV